MNKIRLFQSRCALSGVIEALLLIALVSMVISTIQLVYIPQVMTQKEAEHMDEVSNQFSHLKSMIDIQTSTRSDVPMFSVVTLGSRELPYFVTARAFGNLNISDNADSEIKVGGVSIIPLTSIIYTAYNSYFVDQTYVLEGGGLIVDQPDGTSTMRIDPQVYFKDEGGKVNLYFNLTRFVGKEPKKTDNDVGKCFIRTNYSHADPSAGNPYAVLGGTSITIFTEYPHAWTKSLNRSIGHLVDVRLDSTIPPAYVEIKQKGGGDPIDLYINELYVEVKIGPGWT